MNKIIKDKYDETYYTKTLSNGLKVTIYYKPEFTTTSCVFGTPFGASDLYQHEEWNSHQFHSGLAHFLEHKMFETKGEDVMLQFNAMGANVNAFTSYDCTVYYFTTSDEDVATPLNLLMDFVQDFDVSEESVEKEKEIIVQELMMYQQMPDFRLIFELYKSMYHDNPIKYDIGGSKEDVLSVTREELMSSYRLNYHPSRMSLVIATWMDPEQLMNLIEQNQNKKSFLNQPEVSSNYHESNKSVKHPYREVEMDVNNTKVALGYKFSLDYQQRNQTLEKEWGLQLLMEMHFTSVNPSYQKWLDDGLINSYFNFDVEFGKGYAHLLFMNECEDPQAFKDFIDQQLAIIKEKTINVQCLNQIKNRFYGLAFKVFDDIESIAVNHIRNEFQGIDYFDMIELILKLDALKLKNIITNIDLSQASLVVIKK